MLKRIHSIFNKSSASFQILSDLHLEINQQYAAFEIPVRAKYLILAGDVGRLVDYDNYLDFLRKQTDRYELVFLVLGNHELYDETFATGLHKARQLEQEPSLHGWLILLHRESYEIPGSNVTILGCTLWSKVPNESRDIVQMKISDFKKIQDWTVDDHNASHDADLAWLLGEIESIHSRNVTQKQKPKQSILVVTHHAPSLKNTSSPQHAHNPWSCAFGSDVLSRASETRTVKAWVFGHTHYSTEFKERGIRVVANQRGYVLPWSSTKETKDGFDIEKVIHV